MTIMPKYNAIAARNFQNTQNNKLSILCDMRQQYVLPARLNKPLFQSSTPTILRHRQVYLINL
jgi:hypothetical protein